MKLCFVLLCVMVAAWADNTDHLFDGLVQSLGHFFRTKYNNQYIVTQAVCKSDCEVHLHLSVEMCTAIICVKAGEKFHNVEPAVQPDVLIG